MVREFTWRFQVRSYETDAWGMVPTAGILRYLEQSAVAAAADAGYGAEFHRENNSAWVVRRMRLLMHAPVQQIADLALTTWLSTLARVRGGREYRLDDAASGATLYTAVAEWVYMDRESFTPIAIPRNIEADFDVPGHDLQLYEMPSVEPGNYAEFSMTRRAEWYDADSMGHVNNAVYAQWLDEAVLASLESAGFSIAALRLSGLHLRGEYYSLNYRRSALPGDPIRVVTCFAGISGRVCAVRQSIRSLEDAEILGAESVYGWRGPEGLPADPPPGWPELLSEQRRK